MPINTLTDIEKFKSFFLEKLKQHKDIVSGLLYGNKEFIDQFQVTTIEKGLEELVKSNVIKIEYTPYATYILNEENKITDIEILNIEILKVIKELERTTNKSSIIQFPFTYLNREYSLSIDLRERSLLTLMVYIDKDKQTSTSVDVKDELYINLKNLIKDSLIKRFSNRLRLLLIASKKKEGEFNKEFVASTLAEEFHPEMTLMDALHHCVAAYQEALNHKEFELAYRGDPQTLLMELLKAPSKQVLFPKSSDTYSLEQYYNSYINYILQQLRLTNIGWCRKELGFD